MAKYKINNNEYNKLQKKVTYDLYLSLSLYTIIGVSLIIGLNMITSTNNTFLNKVLQWINLRLDILIIIYIIIGYCFIFNYYWNKPWKYFEEILEASEKLCKENNTVIKLSDPLKNLESKMNQLKISILLNEQASKDLQHKKDELIMCLAHDIKTPLTSIIGYLCLLDEVTELTEDKKEKYIKLILKKSYRLEKLINEFLELTMYNFHQVKLNKEKIDLYYLLFQMIDEFYPTLATNNNKAILNADENIIILGDSIKLVRALGNIFKNSIIYSFENTEIIINVKVKNKKVYIDFKNEGNTIPTEKLSKLFEKFYRGDDARRSNTGGAGLGLAIAKEIIYLHNGEIHANSINNIINVTVILPVGI